MRPANKFAARFEDFKTPKCFLKFQEPRLVRENARAQRFCYNFYSSNFDHQEKKYKTAKIEWNLSKSRGNCRKVVKSVEKSWNQTICLWNPTISAWNPWICVWNRTICAWNPTICMWNLTIWVWNRWFSAWKSSNKVKQLSKSACETAYQSEN